MKNLRFFAFAAALQIMVFAASVSAQTTTANPSDGDNPLSISINIDTEKAKQKALKFLGRKTEKPAQQPAPASQTAQTTTTQQPDKQTVAQPTPAPAHQPTSNLSADKTFGGDWKMVVSVTETLSSDGQRGDAKSTHEIGVALKIEGSRFTGDYTWAKGVCAIAHIEGTLTGAGTFEAVVEYGGGCCGGSKMKMTGTFTSAGTFTAKFKPEGRPGAWCQTWWASIQGVKE